jgi:CheY-like chemotaxis protein
MPPTSSAGLVVLIGEDDAKDVFLIRRALKRLAPTARICEVPDGGEVMACLQGLGPYADREKWPLPRILILDHWMPRMSGIDVLTWMRGDPKFATLPVVILTGGVPPSLAESVSRLKAAFCAKQIDMKKGLEEAMAQALRMAWEQVVQSSARDFVPQRAAPPGLKQQAHCEQDQPEN